MPVMNGWELLEEYQKLDDIQKGKIIIIMLTTSTNPADVTKAHDTPGSGFFIYKPLTLKLLNEIMRVKFPECI
jgi:CheY-like chemotaxis protein